jgi:IstB-like ATP binding protein
VGSIFGDPIIATAILNRLLHRSTTINIRGESYRLKERPQSRPGSSARAATIWTNGHGSPKPQ